MIKQETNSMYLRSKKLLAEVIEEHGETASAKNAIDYLIDGTCDYEIREYPRPRKTSSQRLWTCFFMFVFLFVIPFQWLLTGKTGVTSKTKLGRRVCAMSGEG